VGETSISSRSAFGITTAFDVPTAGTATLTYSSSAVRLLAILAEMGLWAATVFLALARARKKEIVTTSTGQMQMDSPVLSFEEMTK
jgi:hypothetical protein